MTRTKEQIEYIADLAAALTPVADIAVLLGVDEDALRVELGFPGSEAGAAFMRAKAETALLIRRQEIEFAKMGSPAAVHAAAAYLSKCNIDT